MQELVRKHPVAAFSLMAAVGSVVALRPLPSSIPLIAMMVTIRISTQLITPRPHTVWRVTILWLGLTTGCIVSFASAGSAAIGSFIPSIAYSAVFSALGIVPFLVCAQLRIRGLTFPAVWCTWWWFLTSGSPVGRLGAWTPLSGYEAYSWTRPYAGELAIDWITGGWCEALTGFAVTQMMGRVNDEEGAPTVDTGDSMVLPTHHEDHALPATEETPMLQPSRHNDTQTGRQPKQRVVKHSIQITLIVFIIIAAAIPLNFLNPLPAPLYGENRRDIGVACVLPLLDDRHSPFDGFLIETKIIAGRAHIILWPEGAATFESEADRDAKLETVRETAALHGLWIGVGFTEPAPDNGEGGKGKRRNGLAVVDRDGVALEYYKRHLVPLVESFPQIEGKAPPSIIQIKLGSKAKPKAQWNITLSASICLDFAHPSHDLDSKPSLILGPARTWHTNVGRVMMEMAKQRAEELGTRVLWCDGGEGGLSGVVGMGQSGIQVGHGTWVQRLSFEVPIDEKRTVFGAAGAGPALLCAWGLALANLPTGVTLGLLSPIRNVAWTWLQAKVVRLINERR